MDMNVDLQQRSESGPDKGKTKTIRLLSLRCADFEVFRLTVQHCREEET